MKTQISTTIDVELAKRITEANITYNKLIVMGASRYFGERLANDGYEPDENKDWLEEKEKLLNIIKKYENQIFTYQEKLDKANINYDDVLNM